MTILIAESDPELAEQIEVCLRELRYDVIVATSKDNAVARGFAERPNILLTDVHLNGSYEGVAVAEKLRSRMSIAIVYSSAHFEVDLLERLVITEPCGFLPKPFRPSDLRLALALAVRKDVRSRCFEHLLEANPAMLYTRELQGSARIVFMSEDVATQLGCDPGELQDSLGRWIARIHPEDRHAAELAWAASSVETPGACDYRLQRWNGEYRWLHDTFRKVHHSLCSKEEIVGCLFDITDRKRNEYLLARQTRRLERSNKELESFAYAASHDLRAPLRAIDTLSEWIQTDLGEALHGETARQMTLLRGRVKRMDRLLSDLLEYSRIGLEERDTERVDVEELLSEVIDLASPATGFHFEKTQPLPYLTTAKLPLKRVLLNLVINAIKHHDHAEGRIRIFVQEHAEHYEFVVEDDGPGVPPQFHTRIFQMFQTLRRRDSVESSGMGLALVQRIVEAANGRVWVESLVPRGARFIFTWPKIWTEVRPSVPPPPFASEHV
jgi:signal transduction histidine kinase